MLWMVRSRQLFLSTLSLRRATNTPIKAYNIIKDFYPRSPCGERRNVYPDNHQHDAISIHALLAESDNMKMRVICTSINFYPRSPCGERQLNIRQIQKIENISIHALLAESDRVKFKLNFINQISIHALLAESDGPMERGQVYYIRFLSTLSLRRATREPTALRTPHHRFLSTLSLRRAT